MASRLHFTLNKFTSSESLCLHRPRHPDLLYAQYDDKLGDDKDRGVQLAAETTTHRPHHSNMLALARVGVDAHPYFACTACIGHYVEKRLHVFEPALVTIHSACLYPRYFLFYRTPFSTLVSKKLLHRVLRLLTPPPSPPRRLRRCPSYHLLCSVAGWRERKRRHPHPDGELWRRGILRRWRKVGRGRTVRSPPAVRRPGPSFFFSF